MYVADFEELARVAPETVMLEFLNGQLSAKAGRDGGCGTIVMWLLRQCLDERPELALYPELGLKVATDTEGRAIADGALAPLDHFLGQGVWADPGGVLMTVGITPRDKATDHRVRVEKRDAYARAGIPVFLLIDREAAALKVYTAPGGDTYHHRVTHPFGVTVTLPDPVAITLETQELMDYSERTHA